MKHVDGDASLPKTEKAVHALSMKDVVASFGTSEYEGLSLAEVEARQKVYGPNALKEPPRAGLLRRFFAQLADFLVLILIGAATVSAFLGELVDAVVIGAIVVLNAIVSLIQEGKAEEALKSLEKLSAPVAKVIRQGELRVIPARELVPGDLVVLEAGDKVPADIRLIESHGLACNESSLTGESVPADKSAEAVLPEEAVLAERVNMVYSGTMVTHGRGRGVVVSTGMNTEMGKIAGAIQSISREKTPLQRNLEKLGKTLGIAVLGICAGIFFLGVLRDESPMEMFMVAVSLAVAAIPEGLPAVVTVVLAMGVKRMATQNAIIRRLPAVETLGSCTVICTDKTGTITQNKMTVVAAYADGKLMVGDGVELPDPGVAEAGDLRFDMPVTGWTAGGVGLTASLAGAAMANDAMASPGGEQHGFTGDPTEVALVVAAEKGRIHKPVLEKDLPRVFEIPFDSARKRMTTVHKMPDGQYLVWVKGAPEIVIPRCDFVLPGGESKKEEPHERREQDPLRPDIGHALDGNYVVSLVSRLDEMRVPAAGEVIERFKRADLFMASRGIRVIAVAYKIVEQLVPKEDELEAGLTLVGLVGMIDPPRPEAAEAVAKAKQAGVRTVLITGDNPVTALSIARMVGIADQNTKCMSGAEISKIDPDDLDRVLDETGVFGRVSPEHKVDIVAAFRRRGEIVAMTGDGVNDAPALKQADIGVAMGLIGTEVAKEASDMVLADDNFATIVKAIEEGRTIYSNIAKFVVYLLSCNMGEILTITAAMLMRLPVILRPVHILWLNLVTDSFPALALGFEPGEPNAMKQPPRPPDEPLLTKSRWLTVIVQAVLIAMSTVGIFVYGLNAAGNHAYARTMAFATLATAELIRAYTARSDTVPVGRLGVFSNRVMTCGTLASFLLVLAVVQIPGLNQVFSTVRLRLCDWLIVLGVSFIPALGNELRKVVFDRA